MDAFLNSFCKHFWFLAFFSSGASTAFAQSVDEIRSFITETDTKPYDCPETSLNQQVDEYLSLPSLPEIVKQQLLVKKTHGQICDGQHEEAKQALQSLLSQKNVDKSLKYYPAAAYQLGFIYDIQEDSQRCKWYQQAQSLSEGLFTDLHLSASLGLITMCNEGDEEGIKLGEMYALLEQYSDSGDNAALAHIHNNIGLFYASMGQHVLAGEQYQRSYDLGFETYTGSNRLATLISVISSHMASGNFDSAKQTIEEFKRVNQSVDTALSNVWLHFAEAGYYYRTGDMPNLKNSLAKWRIYLDEINSTMYNGLYRWYSAVPCLAEKDKPCLIEFLTQEAQASDGYKAFINRNKDYLRFQVEIHLFLGDMEKATQLFESFADIMFGKVMDQQASGKILGVANLHNQVINLETSLVASQVNRERSIVVIASVSFLFLFTMLYFARKRYMNSLTYDPVTSLLNNRTAINKIRQVPSPSAGRTNALALFDLGNFRDVNRQIGAANSDLALQQIAKTLSQVTRQRDILGRFAPEQFVVCLIDIEEDSAKSFFERIRYALENTTIGDQQAQPVSVRSSMSIYIANDTFVDLDEILDDMQLSLGLQTENV